MPLRSSRSSGERARRSPDTGDDYLVAVAEQSGALLVSGDRHLTDLKTTFPVRTPRAFLDLLTE